MTRFSFSQTSVRRAIAAIVPWIRTFLSTSIYFSCRCRHSTCLHTFNASSMLLLSRRLDQQRVLSTDKLLERSHPLTARRTNLWISETSRTRLLDRKQPANMEFLGLLPLIPNSYFPALGFCFLISCFLPLSYFFWFFLSVSLSLSLSFSVSKIRARLHNGDRNCIALVQWKLCSSISKYESKQIFFCLFILCARERVNIGRAKSITY